MKANPSGPEGLALQGASAALRGLAVGPATACDSDRLLVAIGGHVS
jgi:hypothetical protein